MKIFEVETIKNIDVSKYPNGGIFFTSKNVYILHYGEMKQIDVSLSSLKTFIRKTIKEELEKGV